MFSDLAKRGLLPLWQGGSHLSACIWPRPWLTIFYIPEVIPFTHRTTQRFLRACYHPQRMQCDYGHWIMCYKLECRWLSATLHTAKIRPKHGRGDSWSSDEPVTKQWNFLSHVKAIYNLTLHITKHIMRWFKYQRRKPDGPWVWLDFDSLSLLVPLKSLSLWVWLVPR